MLTFVNWTPGTNYKEIQIQNTELFIHNKSAKGAG